MLPAAASVTRQSTVVGNHLKGLFLLYMKPVSAIGQILDRGRLWFAILAAVVVSITLHITDVPLRGAGSLLFRFISFTPGGYLAPLIMIAIAFVPAIIAWRAIFGYGSFGVLINTDYAPLLMCAFTCWAAAYLPLALLRSFTDFEWTQTPPVYLAANIYFASLSALSVRTIYGAGFPAALGITALGWIVAVLSTGLIGVLGSAMYLLMSPFALYYLYAVFGSNFRSLGEGMRSRQHFQEQLQIATNNPHDADAHYQLGLIHQKRRQYSEAIARFERAVQIDPELADAHMQLGVIAREHKRFDGAFRHLAKAAALDDKLAQNDVWRELGAAYLGASQTGNAVAALAKYVDRRPYDPEGLFWYGKALAQADKRAEAREMFERAIEAVNTMPSHRRAQVRRWRGQAQAEIRKI
jgi:tetratricopeptide (TPR) repeat protein